jgi:hypothetical protein
MEKRRMPDFFSIESKVKTDIRITNVITLGLNADVTTGIVRAIIRSVGKNRIPR